jgi:DNA-binding NtrC family response regulator
MGHGIGPRITRFLAVRECEIETCPLSERVGGAMTASRNVDTDREEQCSAALRWIPPEPHLFVVLEGARPTAGGLRCSLEGLDELVLARGPVRRAERASGGKMTLTLPDSKVSTHHANLMLEEGAWVAHDRVSTNGTFVNGERITRQRLVDGDFIAIGQSVLRIRLNLPTPDGTPFTTSAETKNETALGIATLIPALASELAVVGRVAASKVPILLLGETGTGKEVLARAIHSASKRDGSFVAVNCAGLPGALVEAQLFGHTRGAFSGATRDEIGFVRAAERGTLFLDEIGDLPPAAQGALLRFLQEGEVVPLGSTRTVAVDVRVVAATHQPIEAMLEREAFRRDLFARLHGFTHRAWPLADRLEDVGTLVGEIIRRLSPDTADTLRIAVDAARALAQHRWPMNVRELVQALSRALALADGGIIDLEHLPPTLAPTSRRPSTPSATAEPLSAEEAAVREQLTACLARYEGNVAAVAREMSKAPMQIYRWMKRLGIDPKTFR